MSNPISLSIVICTYNREKYIGEALESVLKQQLPPNMLVEMIAVDNNSTDRSAEIIKDFIAAHPNAPYRYCHEAQQGLSFARNRGIAEAKGKYIAFIDDDAIAHPHFARFVIQFFEAHPDATALGGKVIPRFTQGEPDWLSKYVKKVVSEIDFGNKVKLLPGRKYPFGANMSFRAAAFEQFGVFNTELGRKGNNLLGGEEKDIFDRIKNGGGKIYYSPDVQVQHIIDPYRLTDEYLRKFCQGVGISERIRFKEKSKAAGVVKDLSYGVKSAGSKVLATLFIVKGEPAKGKMINKVMKWIMEGYRSQ